MHPGGGGGGGYSLTSPIRVCAAERGPDFWTPEIEQGIYFRDFTRTGCDIGDRSENFKMSSIISTYPSSALRDSW